MGFLKDTTLINSYHSDSTTSTTSSNGSRDDTSINSDDSSGSDKENHPRKQAKVRLALYNVHRTSMKLTEILNALNAFLSTYESLLF